MTETIDDAVEENKAKSDHRILVAVAVPNDKRKKRQYFSLQIIPGSSELHCEWIQSSVKGNRPYEVDLAPGKFVKATLNTKMEFSNFSIYFLPTLAFYKINFSNKRSISDPTTEDEEREIKKCKVQNYSPFSVDVNCTILFHKGAFGNFADLECGPKTKGFLSRKACRTKGRGNNFKHTECGVKIVPLSTTLATLEDTIIKSCRAMARDDDDGKSADAYLEAIRHEKIHNNTNVRLKESKIIYCIF
jgi:hypothetical protein